jgi:nitroimidazol reductase NimA-like FMN-containing flavoprotein (pyridoxamine 5'-phosphate oxidase superfamily)
MADVLPDEAEILLDEESVMAHLATCSDGRPHAAPVWYHYDDGTVSILTGGRKLENIRENPRVAVSIQKDIAGEAEWKVTMLGTARVIEDKEEALKAAERINPRYGADVDAYPQNTLVRIDVGSGTFMRY